MSSTVYQYFGSGGHLLYVGITDRGVRRAHEHADTKDWWELAVGCSLEHYPTREAALDRERELIERYRPPYNFQHNPERNLPLAERTGLNNRQQQDRAIGGAGVKERKRAWYRATPTERALMSCAVCRQRPPVNGPSCMSCQMRFRSRQSTPVR